MEQELLRYLLAAFPKTPATLPPDADDGYLVLHGYRVPFEAPVDEVMPGVLADFRRRGFGKDAVAGFDRG